MIEGVFDYVKTHGEDRFTWQPQSGVRNAAVVAPYVSQTGSGYVLVGRSLREIEKREAMVGKYVLSAWLASLVTSFILIVILL